MKIRSVRAEFFHADGRTDGPVEPNSRFSKFCKRAKKILSWREEVCSREMIRGAHCKGGSVVEVGNCWDC